MNTSISSMFRKSQPHFNKPTMIVKEMKQGTVSSFAGLGIVRKKLDKTIDILWNDKKLLVEKITFDQKSKDKHDVLSA